MSKFLKFCLLLAVSFTVVNAVYLALLPYTDWDFAKAKTAHELKGSNYKLLVFGNSTAMDGINTEMLSKQFGDAYNLSLGGASPEVNYVQLRHYLQYNPAPEKLLLFLSSAHIRYTKYNDFNPIVEHYYDTSSFKFSIKEVPLFKFRWLFIGNIKKLFSAEHRSARVVKGQLRMSKTVADNTVATAQPRVCREQAFYTAEGYKYMWKIAALCRQKNIQFQVFEMPCWKDARNNCPDIKLTNPVDGFACDINLINLNKTTLCDSIFDPKKDWLSKNHLNQSGAVKLTETVARLVSK